MQSYTYCDFECTVKVYEKRDNSIIKAIVSLTEIETNTYLFGFISIKIKTHVHAFFDQSTIRSMFGGWRDFNTGKKVEQRIVDYIDAQISLANMDKAQECPPNKDPIFAIDTPEIHGGYNEL